MAKLGSFFRRLFSPNSSDLQNSSPSLPHEPRQSLLSCSPPKVLAPAGNEMLTRSCCTSPRLPTQTILKQTTINIDSTEESASSNFLSSNTSKINDRRLSAPLIVHTSNHTHSQYHSTPVNETTEEALISSLQRFSLSSTTGPTAVQGNQSLGPSRSGSISTSPRADVRSASFNLSPSNSNSLILPSSLSNNLLNNISSASGRLRAVQFSVLSCSRDKLQRAAHTHDDRPGLHLLLPSPACRRVVLSFSRVCFLSTMLINWIGSVFAGERNDGGGMQQQSFLIKQNQNWSLFLLPSSAPWKYPTSYQGIQFRRGNVSAIFITDVCLHRHRSKLLIVRLLRQKASK